MRWLSITLFIVGTIAYGQRSDFARIDFNKADRIALEYRGASLENLPVLVHNLTTDLTTQVEKFRAIYTWVCTNIENDYGAYQKTIKKRRKLLQNPDALAEWNHSFTPKVFKKLVQDRTTACTGYAFLIREMAGLADIKSNIVNGYGRTPTLMLTNHSIPNHSWNSVELNGKWYLCDPTWSAGKIILEDQGARFEPDYFDGYFLAEPELFIRNHYPLDIKFSLLSEPPSFNTFIEGPVVYKEAFSSEIIPILPSKMKLEVVKNEMIAFSLKVPKNENHEKLLLVVSKGVGDRTIQPRIISSHGKRILELSFEKTGLYDVHVKIDDRIIFTYVVRVRKK